jgi:hypothetical protein
VKLSADHNLIWNRACGSSDASRPGDRALRDAIELDGLIQNGGVAHGFDSADDWLDGVRGLEHFGLDDLAALLRELHAALPGEDAAEDVWERYAADADDRYDRLEDSDRLQAAMVARLASHPEEFAPITDADREAEARTQELLGRLMGG